MFFSLAPFGSVSKVLSLSRLSLDVRASLQQSLHPCNATLGALAGGGVTRPIDIVNKVYLVPIVPVVGRLKR